VKASTLHQRAIVEVSSHAVIRVDANAPLFSRLSWGESSLFGAINSTVKPRHSKMRCE
jgi:hypothetical protein